MSTILEDYDFTTCETCNREMPSIVWVVHYKECMADTLGYDVTTEKFEISSRIYFYNELRKSKKGIR